VKLLLDVSTLVAPLWKSHVHHQRAVAWRQGKTLVLCPITELGFIRVSTSPAYNLTMADARQLLAEFIRDEQPEFIPADTRALDGTPAPSSSKSTDWYLANLVDAHGMKLVTFDGGLSHPAAEQIP
jgi:predicted nucleic acid-binding protein